MTMPSAVATTLPPKGKSKALGSLLHNPVEVDIPHPLSYAAWNQSRPPPILKSNELRRRRGVRGPGLKLSESSRAKGERALRPTQPVKVEQPRPARAHPHRPIMMEGFIERFGSYPFSRFGFVAENKGEMEHQACVTHVNSTVNPDHLYDFLWS